MTIRLLADAPQGWSDVPLKRLVRFTAGATPESDSPEFWTHDDVGATPWVAIGDMSQRDVVTDTAKSLTRAGLASKRLVAGPPGTLLFAMYASVGETAFLTTSATWNQAILGLTARSGVELRFVRYALMSLRPYLGSEFRSNTQNNLNAQQVGDLVLPTPPFQKQRTIADFLDRETAEIDALIEKQSEMIGLLRERRLSTINAALSQAPGVTRTPMRNVVEIQSGVTLGKSYGPEVHVEEYPYLRVANVQTGYVDTTDLATIALPPLIARQSLLRPGDVLITEGGDRAALARGSLWHGQVDPCLHQNHLYVLRPKPHLMIAEYLVYLLEGSDARQYFERTRRQTTNLSATNSSIVRAFRFTLLSVKAQEALVDRLDQETDKIDALIEKLEEFVSLARERRAALITAVVTGQIDVLRKAS